MSISYSTPRRYVAWLLVYRPEGGGSINRNIPTRGAIIVPLLCGCTVFNYDDVKQAITRACGLEYLRVLTV